MNNVQAMAIEIVGALGLVALLIALVSCRAGEDELVQVPRELLTPVIIAADAIPVDVPDSGVFLCAVSGENPVCLTAGELRALRAAVGE